MVPVCMSGMVAAKLADVTPSEELPVLYSAADGIATITLNRPRVLNAMGGGLLEGLQDGLERAASDTSVRVLVLTGSGRGFCAGADLGSVGGSDERLTGAGALDEASGEADALDEAVPDEAALAAIGDNTAKGMDEVFHPIIRRLMGFPVPTVARINGVVAGAGIGLALGCDIAIAAHSASFVSTFGPRLGLVPDLGAGWQMARRIGRARSLGMALLGDKISARQAQDWGLIWDAVPDEELDTSVDAVAQRLRRSSPTALARTREVMDDAIGRSLDDQLDAEREHQRYLVPRNMIKAAEAFMTKQEPVFDR